MLNYLKKFALEILPSVAATVIGAYIVNHYISAKPAADAPVAAAVSPAEVKKNAPKPANIASIPEHGITAKGISERAMMEKSASERPGEFKPAEARSEAKSSEAKSSEAKPSEAKAEAKPSESKSETANAPAKHVAPKAVAKTTPAPAASPAATVETASAPAEDHRDANDLARAAIERLRKEDSQSHAQEASRAPDPPRLQEAPRAIAAPPMATASVRPLPPPITVIAPPVEGQGDNQGNNQGNSPSNMASNPAPYTASINADNPNRLVPPADIPPPPPIDLRADASKLATRTNNMAQDVLAKTRSMFHALLPGSNGDGGDNRQSSSASQFTD